MICVLKVYEKCFASKDVLYGVTDVQWLFNVCIYYKGETYVNNNKQKNIKKICWQM